jgi:hypothetical protein
MKPTNAFKRILSSWRVFQRPAPHTPLTTADICRRYARGNIFLQLGRVMTAKKYETLKKKVLSYDF